MEHRPNFSLSPHIHSGNSIRKSMTGVLVALAPAFLTGVYLFRLNTVVITALSVLSCVGFEYVTTRFFLKKEASISDCSAIVAGVLLAFMLPPALPLWLIPVGAFAAIVAGKMFFGGLGKNIFNPALVGYVVLLLFFPSQMLFHPIGGTLHSVDATTSATILSGLKLPPQDYPSMLHLFFGIENGTIGETSAFALLLGFAYLLWRKIISWRIPVAIFAAVAVFCGILWLFHPEPRYNPFLHLLSGGLMLGAIFMATDYVTSPMTRKGMLVYGAGIGIITVCIRLWGVYPEGMAFAILLMNAFTPLIDKTIVAGRFAKTTRTRPK